MSSILPILKVDSPSNLFISVGYCWDSDEMDDGGVMMDEESDIEESVGLRRSASSDEGMMLPAPLLIRKASCNKDMELTVCHGVVHRVWSPRHNVLDQGLRHHDPIPGRRRFLEL